MFMCDVYIVYSLKKLIVRLKHIFSAAKPYIYRGKPNYLSELLRVSSPKFLRIILVKLVKPVDFIDTVDGSEIRRSPPGMHETL